MPTHISELSYSGSGASDFIEIATTAGTDLSGYSIYLYGSDGLLDEGPISLGSVQSTNAGKDVYVVDNTGAQSFANLHPSQGIAVVDELGNVVQFISFDGNTITASAGPANGLTTTEIGTATSGDSLESTDGGSSYSVQSSPSEGTIPCYAPGTLIDTPEGPRAVESLRPGDLVDTVDHGPQVVRFVRSGDHSLEDAEIDDKPVLIKSDALGAGRPAHDLIVSPQHRILVGGGGQLTQYFESEAFAPAKALSGLPGIRHMTGKSQVTWVHFACDRHEVIIANGCFSESLLLGSMVVNGMTPSERDTVTDVYGSAPSDDAAINGPATRRCLYVGEVRQHLAASEKMRRAVKGFRK